MVTQILYCPKCNYPMIIIGECKYETLSDHVFDPNGEDRPIRPMFACPKGCTPEHSFYGVEGGWFSSSTKRECELRNAWYINRGSVVGDFFYRLLKEEQKLRGVDSFPAKYWQAEYIFVKE